MIDNAASLLRPFVGLAFLAAGVLMLRTPALRAGGVLIIIGAAFFTGGELYGVLTVRPFIGGAYDEHWQAQRAATEVLSTFGLVICAAGLLLVAARRPKSL